MNRRTRTIVVLGIALSTGLVASAAVYKAVAAMPARAAGVAHDYVVVAARTLPVGTELTAHDLRKIPWPKGNAIAGTTSSIQSLVGRGLIAGVLENEPITESRVAPRDAGAGLPPAIPPGMRAISVKVDEVVGVAGFVVPGTHVDVLVTLTSRNGQEQMSRVVVSNVTVLTAGSRYDQEQSKTSKPIKSTVVTVLVAPEDAERIALAAAEGHIMLALRNPLDTAPTLTTGAHMTSLMGTQPARAPVVARRIAAPAPATPPVAAVVTPPAAVEESYKVIAIRAAQQKEEVVP
jgi:pilus assembly protein CpaB